MAVTYDKAMRQTAKDNKESKNPNQHLCTIDVNAGEMCIQGPVSKETAREILRFAVKLMNEKKF